MGSRRSGGAVKKRRRAGKAPALAERFLTPGGLSPLTVGLLGALLPALVLLIAYIRLGILPFGGRAFLESDATHQYLPFLTELRRKLSQGEGLFYSFSGGLGYNFWATLAYYAASPWNLLLLLVREQDVSTFMCWSIFLKLCAAGGLLSWTLYRRHDSCPWAAAALGWLYALSNFFLGYKFNLMWLDSAAVLPLILYGLERLVGREGSGLYLFSLFYALWCNYYIGFMVCVFSCLYLLCLLCEQTRPLRDTGSALGRFALSSLAGGGMAMVLLLPAYMALRLSEPGQSGKGPGLEFYNNGLDMLRQMFWDSPSIHTSYDRGQVQLYCGVIVLLLLALYFVNTSISRRTRLCRGGLLALLLLSFSFSPLNYLWHGLHLEVGIPNRFAFVYVVLALTLCYDSLCALEGLSRRRLLLTAAAVLTGTAAFALWELLREEGWKLLISLGLLALYAALLCLLHKGRWRRLLPLLLCLALLGEAASHAIPDLGKKEPNDTEFFRNYQADSHALLDSRPGFYRLSVDSDSSINFATLLGSHGTALFNSTMQRSVRDYFDKLLCCTRLNTVYDRGLSRIMLDVLGVRYRISGKVSGESLGGFEKVEQQGDRSLFENPDALSLGFLVSEDILQWDGSVRGIEGQNEFIRLCCGVPELFRQEAKFFGRSEVNYHFDIPQDSSLYLDIRKGKIQTMDWRTPEFKRSYDKHTDFLLEAYPNAEMQHANLIITTEDGETYHGVSYVCRGEDYRAAVEALSACQLEKLSVSGSRVSGTIRADREGILLLTVPWNPGWRARVDGQEAEILELGGVFMGLRLSEGEHSVSLRYTPQGFWAGLALTALSAGLAAGILLTERKSRRKERKR